MLTDWDSMNLQTPLNGSYGEGQGLMGGQPGLHSELLASLGYM